MKTICLQSNGSLWVELRQDGKRFLVKVYTFKRIETMKWFRNLAKAETFFLDACDEFADEFLNNFRLEKKGGEK